MAKLGDRFTEIGRGYEKVSDNYKRPYILGVDINDREKPFVLASGDHHSDSGAELASTEELISDRWKNHIEKADCSVFVEQLRKTVKNGEGFPQGFIKEIVNKKLTDKG